jgi:hypothetical protein
MAQVGILDRVRRIAWRMAAAVLLATGGLTGSSYGTLVDFEDLSLAPNSFWNGSDGTGGFSSRGASFNNTYTPAYGSWSGFAYSNVNYSDTSYELDPIANPFYQYAAVTGTGVGGSGNYAVGYGCSSCITLFGGVLPQMTIPANMEVNSAMFTNTTYAAASMLNGDPSAKKFGPGDWLKLTITGQCAPNHVIGSVQFFLAQNGSIVDDWRSVDLSSLAGARTLTFDLTSTDNGELGMNTPAFFAMDSLTLSPLLPGDFNVDGYVNALDLDIWRANNGRSGLEITWRSGDANCDGVVDGLDKDIWFAHAFRSLYDNLPPGSPSAIDVVPEPSTLALALAGGLTFLARCLRRRRE